MTERLLVLGAGGFAHAVAEAVLLGSGYRLVGFVDDRHPALQRLWEWPVLGRLCDLASLRAQADVVVPAIGDADARRAAVAAARDAGFALVTVIHPQALVSPRARIAAGAAVMAGAVIGTEACVGEAAIVNAGAVLDHHAVIGAYAHVGIGARIGGGARLGADAVLRIGEVLGPGAQLDRLDG